MDLLFDLDGTLTDPGAGITRCMAHALRAVGIAPPPAAELTRFIGPPLRDTFAELVGPDPGDRVDAAVAAYRDRFGQVGFLENRVHPDVVAALPGLRSAGFRLWVATSKPHVYALRIVEHFGLTEHFVAVHGSELSGVRADKAALVGYIVECEGLEASRTWMIGDRSHDIVGGRANGTRTAGVLWGYGSESELRGAGADVVATTMSELVTAVTGRSPSDEGREPAS